MIALTPKKREPNPDSLFLAAIVLKLIQRGSLPSLPLIFEEAFENDLMPLTIEDELPETLARAIPESKTALPLDPSFKLHPALEEPFWRDLGEASPDTLRWMTPQASLEALAKINENQYRWVDFLYFSPFTSANARVIEIQGSQHNAQRDLDNSRAKLLNQQSNISVRPVNPDGLTTLVHKIKEAGVNEGRVGRQHDLKLDEAAFGPSAIARFIAAIALLLENGNIRPNSILRIELVADYESTILCGRNIFQFIDSIQRLWNLNALPREIFLNGVSVFTSSEVGAPTDLPEDQIRISLEQHTPAHAVLPSAEISSCIVRGTYLPVDLSFIPPILPSPRLLRPKDPDVPQILEQLLRDIFGHEKFRPNQLEAILSGMSGADSIVLLPTGSGKSVIYQMVGLLQPGITMVVDPIVSLIDDQIRNLNAVGIDRAYGIHSSQDFTTAEKAELQSFIANGQALFALIAPERLQMKSFRETLEELTKSTIVNSAVLDEAHCISEWGHDFRTAYLNVAKNLRTLCQHEGFAPTILALTGTASPSVLRDIERELAVENGSIAKIKPDSHDRKNLHYVIQECKAGESHAALENLLSNDLPSYLQISPSQIFKTDGVNTKSGIIFTTTVNGKFKSASQLLPVVETIGRRLLDPSDETNTHLPIVEVFSSTPPKPESNNNWGKKKQENARKFIENEIPALVATKSFGMGIDKSNIRWTLHFGYPSSLEAFAQESGRAGRDNKDAYCMLLTTPADAESIRQLLDLQKPTEIRSKDYRSTAFKDTDISTHLFFHARSFKGRLSEFDSCIQVLKKIRKAYSSTDEIKSLAKLANGIIDLENRIKPEPEIDPSGNSLPRRPSIEADEIERALYRLSAIGVVSDYLVNYGSKSFSITLSDCTLETFDLALINSIKRIAPGKINALENQILAAPNDVDDRIRHHLIFLIETLYDTIEPARIRALIEMQQLSSSKLEDSQIRARLNAYLSSGPLATAIEEVAESTHLDVSEMTTLLDTVETQDPDIWIGTTARQLETYPDNPILLSARVIGEGWRDEPDLAIIQSALNSAFSVLDQYQLNATEAAELVAWVASKFEQQSPEFAPSKFGAILDAWEINNLPEGPLLEWEASILEKATKNANWLPQLSRIRQRRMGSTLTKYTEQLDRLKQ